MARKSLLKRAVSSFTALAIATVAMPVIPAFAEVGTVSYSFDGYDVEYSVKSEWVDGQNIEVKITNTGDEPILNWAFKYDAEGVIDGLWNASVYDTKETSYIIKNAGWNYEIAPKASVSFGYTLFDYSGTNPNNFELCAKRVDKTDGYDVQYNITNEWDTGLQGEIVITNTSEEPMEFWQLSFDSDVTIDSIWNASVDKQEESSYTIGGGNTPINAGENKTIGFIGTKTSEFISISKFSLSTVDVEGLGENGSIFNNGKTEENNTGNNNSEENENIVSEGCYPYTMFAASSDEGAITINADNFCVNGDIATNGTILFSGNKKVNGKKIENAGLKPFYLFDKIKSKYLSSPSCYQIEEDYSLNNDNIIVNDPVNVKGKVSLNGTIGITSAVEAIESITLKGNVINISGAVVCSKYRDVCIEGQNVSVSGLIYAPFGEVKIKSPNLNLNNVVVIANKIYLESSSINANNNEDFARFIGQDSGLINVPIDEFKYLPDTDGDDIPDVIEEQIGIDPYNPDTDGDLLNDGYEVFTTFTDPVKIDTDENGINDPDEDFDTDGLSNIEENNYKTNPYIPDTDNDSLSDSDEANIYGTNPLMVDTDGDGLNDADEIAIGTNPLNPDTDNDGIFDCDEKFNQTFTHTVENEDCAIEEVIITLEGTGNIQTNTTVVSVMGSDVICSDVVGLIGEPFSIETASRFDIATLAFKIDQSKLVDTAFDDLMFLWYDEQNYKFVELETFYDYENSIVKIETTHFSRYMVVDKYKWFEAWSMTFDYNPGREHVGENYAGYNKNYTVLAIDCSGSMSSNDRINTKTNISSAFDAKFPNTCERISAGEQFVSNMMDDDLTSIVLFDNSAFYSIALTSDKEKLKLGLQKVCNRGGTEFLPAIKSSLDMFSESELNDTKANKRIILLSDGGDFYPYQTKSYLNNLYNDHNPDKRNDVKIYTIALGSGADEAFLEDIANITNGVAYKAFSAEELVDIYSEIGIGGDFDTTDTDDDGLYDAVETAGIRLQNGIIIYTDPTAPDSDQDGLPDGKEIDPTIRWSEKHFNSTDIGHVVKKQYFFAMISDPNNKDSDDDGLEDNIDKERLIPDDSSIVEINYLPIFFQQHDTTICTLTHRNGDVEWYIWYNDKPNEIKGYFINKEWKQFLDNCYETASDFEPYYPWDYLLYPDVEERKALRDYKRNVVKQKDVILDDYIRRNNYDIPIYSDVYYGLWTYCTELQQSYDEAVMVIRDWGYYLADCLSTTMMAYELANTINTVVDVKKNIKIIGGAQNYKDLNSLVKKYGSKAIDAWSIFDDNAYLALEKYGENKPGVTPSFINGGKPLGVKAIGKSTGIKKQNETAELLAQKGYKVEMLIEDANHGNGYGIKAMSNPDYLIENQAFDCYTPDADTPTKNICNMISRKTKTQATRIVLNLDLKDKIEIKNVLEQVFAKTYDGDLKAMDELIVVYQGEIIWHFVR